MTAYYTQAQIDEIGALIGQEILNSNEALKQFVQDKIAALEPVTPPAPTEPEAGDGTTPAPAAGTFLDDGREIKQKLITFQTPRSWEDASLDVDLGIGKASIISFDALINFSPAWTMKIPPNHVAEGQEFHYKATIVVTNGISVLRVYDLGASVKQGNIATVLITYLA